MVTSNLHTEVPPPEGLQFLDLSTPTTSKDILLVRMNDPKTLNSLSSSRLSELDDMLSWYDREPTLRVLVITGTGRAFTAGADLREWRASLQDTTSGKKFGQREGVVPFTRRKGVKPVIAAVNGFALGGGCEFAVNCDLVIASSTAKFGLPEVHVGLAPTGGVLTRIVHTVGMQIASEIVLTGRHITAQEMHTWGIVNKVVPEGESVVIEALRYAEMIARGSPDAVVAARAGLRQAWETADVENATEDWLVTWLVKLEKGENMKEGLAAFTEKRAPRWRPAKL